MSNLKLRSLTIFAPTNEAFQKYTGSPVQVQYHMCKYEYKPSIHPYIYIIHRMCARGPSQRFLSFPVTQRHPLFITFSMHPSRLMFILISHWVAAVAAFCCVTNKRKIDWNIQTNEPEATYQSPSWVKGFSIIISSRRCAFDIHTV